MKYLLLRPQWRRAIAENNIFYVRYFYQVPIIRDFYSFTLFLLFSNFFEIFNIIFHGTHFVPVSPKSVIAAKNEHLTMVHQ